MLAPFGARLMIALAMLLSLPIGAAESLSQDALQRGKALARALKVEESARSSIVNIIAFRTATSPVPRAKYDCVQKANVSFAYDIYGAALARTLSAQEMDQASAFFGSPAGKLDLAMLDSNAIDTLPTETLVALSNFTTTSAFEKMRSHAYATPEFKRELAAKLEPIVFACIGGPGR